MCTGVKRNVNHCLLPYRPLRLITSALYDARAGTEPNGASLFVTSRRNYVSRLLINYSTDWLRETARHSYVPFKGFA